MNTYISNRIGFWYDDKNWAYDMFETILENIPYEAVNRYFMSLNDMKIELKNDSSITFVKATESNRRKRFTESYVHTGIKREFVDVIVTPCTMFGKDNVFIVDKYSDLNFPRKYYKNNGSY